MGSRKEAFLFFLGGGAKWGAKPLALTAFKFYIVPYGKSCRNLAQTLMPSVSDGGLSYKRIFIGTVYMLLEGPELGQLTFSQMGEQWGHTLCIMPYSPTILPYMMKVIAQTLKPPISDKRSELQARSSLVQMLLAQRGQTTGKKMWHFSWMGQQGATSHLLYIECLRKSRPRRMVCPPVNFCFEEGHYI